MIEERRESIEQEIESLQYDREVLRALFHKVDGVVSGKTLSDIIFDIHLMENRIERLRKQLPPLMSQRQLRALEEIPKVWAEVTGKKIGNTREEALNEALHRELWNRFDKPKEEALCEAADKTLQEYADIAAGRDLESTAKRFEEAREEHGTPTWKVDKDRPVGGIFIDDDNVAHVNGTIETPRMVIEAAPRRTGRTFRSWLHNYFK